MKICKKLTALLLCFITVFGFVSCADNGFLELFALQFTDGGGLYMKSDWEDDISEPVFVDFTVHRKHFEELNETQKRAYKFIYNSIFAHPGKIYIKNISPDEMLEVFEALKYDNGHLLCLADDFSYLESGSLLCFMPNYTHSSEECLSLCGTLVSDAKEIVGMLEDENEDFVKEVFVNDSVARMCVYGKSDNSSNAAGVFFDKKAVCSGYSLASKLLFDLCEIESFTVSGKAIQDGKKEGHMWLAVKIDGQWYHFDPTWNDPESKDENIIYGYRYFNLTTEEISKTHSDFVLPDDVICTATDAQYYIRNGLYCTQENWLDIVEHTVQSVVLSLPACAAFEFESSKLLDKVSDRLFVSSTFLAKVLNGVYKYTGKKASDYEIAYSTDSDRNILEIYFK